MVVRNKWIAIFDEYREVLKKRLETSKHSGPMKRGNKTKNRLLNFYLKNNRWPNRRDARGTELQLATRFENFISKKSPTYDPHFRNLAMVTGRTTNNKRSHNVDGFKKEILQFIKTHGRVPTTLSGEVIKGEGCLRNKLDYYTKTRNDTTLLSKVYSLDKCHRSGIPAKYRPIINEQLDLAKPLIRSV